VVVHRFPRQPGQGGGVDAQHHPQALPPLGRHRLGGTVPSGHLTCSQQSGEKDLAGIPQQLLVLRRTASRRGRGQQLHVGSVLYERHREKSTSLTRKLEYPRT
jgi:hypothetical protein